MLNYNLHLDAATPVDQRQPTVPAPQAEPLNDRLFPGQFLAPLGHVIDFLDRRTHQGGSQVIIRFKNDYGAIISEYRLLEGIYEIAPLRFQGPGRDDYEFYFRSHVPDLTWCSHPHDMVSVCEQIARLLPRRMV
ncbi:MAG: hypothetical protein WBV23_14450 [Desulfobaccales bacterium]